MNFRGSPLTKHEYLSRHKTHDQDTTAHAEAFAQHAADPDAHGAHVTPITFLAPVVAGINWAVPAADAEFPGNTRFRTKMDLTRFSQARLVARVITAAGTGAKLRWQYSLDQSTWDELDGATGPQIAADGANTTADSNWVDLTAPAKADAFLRLIGTGGDGATSGNFGLIVGYLR